MADSSEGFEKCLENVLCILEGKGFKIEEQKKAIRQPIGDCSHAGAPASPNVPNAATQATMTTQVGNEIVMHFLLSFILDFKP